MGTLKSDREGGSEGGGGENLQRLPRGSVLQTAHAQSVQHHGQVHPKGFSTTDRAGNLLSPLPTGSPSMGCGGSSGVRRLLGKDELRLLVCQSPLGGEEKG